MTNECRTVCGDLVDPTARVYSIVITTASHPQGVRHPGPRGGWKDSGSMTRAEAIEALRSIVSRGRTSDYLSEFGAYAEGPSERFTLSDIEEEDTE